MNDKPMPIKYLIAFCLMIKKNIYVIINESYPNFKDKNLYEEN